MSATSLISRVSGPQRREGGMGGRGGGYSLSIFWAVEGEDQLEGQCV